MFKSDVAASFKKFKNMQIWLKVDQNVTLYLFLQAVGNDNIFQALQDVHLVWSVM